MKESENIKHVTVGVCIARPQNKNQRGITLIALIITIIVMLILAGVALNLTIGERGIFKTVQNAKTEYEKQQLKEELELILLDIQTSQNIENRKFTTEEIENILIDNGYTVISSNENEFIVKKNNYIFTIVDLIIQDIREDVIVPAPDMLEDPTFNYDKTNLVQSVKVKINYPAYATKREYKLENGEWKTYTREILLVENNTIYARYTTSDGRNSKEISEVISNIDINMLNYTDAETYFLDYPSAETIKNKVKLLFDRSKYNEIINSNLATYAVYFGKWCTDVVYFQDNKTEPIEAKKVTIVTQYANSGYEPIKEFYITASNTITFDEEVELYRGQHNVTNDLVNVSEHTFEPKGKYQFYRLYATSWHPVNKMDGQHICGCYIE